MSVERKRPFGITILAILLLFGGIIGLCLPTFLLMGSGLFGLAGVIGSAVGLVGIIAALLMLIGPILQIVVALGALNLRGWAWWLGIVATGLSLVGAAIHILNGMPVWPTLASVALPIIILVYLLTPRVRDAFQVT